MPTEPSFFRDACNRCNWIFDLFAYGFDFLNGRFFPPALELRGAEWEREEQKIADMHLVESIVDADGQVPLQMRRYLQIPGRDAEVEEPEFCMRLYCALVALDRAVADLNYLAVFARPLPGRWEEVTGHIERNRQQLQRSASGYVVFQPPDFETAGRTWQAQTLAGGSWTEIPSRGVNLQDYFRNLLRVEGVNECAVHIRLVSPAQDFETDSSQLRIGIVPLVNELKPNASDAQLIPGPLRLVKESVSPSAFGIRMDPPKDPARPCEELCERADAALRYLASRGAQVVLFPEMVVPDPVLTKLRSVLYDLTDSRKQRPSLVLAGTFSRPSTGHPSTVPFNVAVILNGNGEELWRQRKLQPYEMKRYEQKRFGVLKILDSDSCVERMAFVPRELQFVDSRRSRLRMVVLICEDATRPPGVSTARNMRANLILTPVMAGPLTNDCGFALSLDPVVNDYDAVFVVANSGPLARAAWTDPKEPVPLGIVGVPLVSEMNDHKTHKLLREHIPVPGHSALEVLYFQLPET